MEKILEKILEVKLDKLLVGVSVSLPPDTVISQNAVLTVTSWPEFNSLCMKLDSFVLSQTVTEKSHRLKIEVPATWWDHFKRDCFPNWLLRRFPPQVQLHSEKVTFKLKETYPKMPAMSTWGDPVTILILDTKQEVGARYLKDV